MPLGSVPGGTTAPAGMSIRRMPNGDGGMNVPGASRDPSHFATGIIAGDVMLPYDHGRREARRSASLLAKVRRHGRDHRVRVLPLLCERLPHAVVVVDVEQPSHRHRTMERETPVSTGAATAARAPAGYARHPPRRAVGCQDMAAKSSSRSLPTPVHTTALVLAAARQTPLPPPLLPRSVLKVHFSITRVTRKTTMGSGWRHGGRVAAGVVARLEHS
ncbi:hypothetical protein OBBRIDRAFT_407174 [Obba rivulosa]|uniref:Uncharacterized protein n=1 Tax=Obba rivulosa TaxID=1052685 RepID=A0A8E2AHU5_9APHY|nr:hypothetical protein OBBRIDRAFT_407174 [Obba rivulosa]